MRGFRKKIEWQRKVLESVNWRLLPERQLSGLTKQVVSAWEIAHPGEVSVELRLMIFRASELTQSINDFSTPVTLQLEDVQDELEQLCDAIRAAAPIR